MITAGTVFYVETQRQFKDHTVYLVNGILIHFWCEWKELILYRQKQGRVDTICTQSLLSLGELRFFLDSSDACGIISKP